MDEELKRRIALDPRWKKLRLGFEAEAMSAFAQHVIKINPLCHFCGNPIIGRRSDAKYCNDACKALNHRHQQP